MRLKKWYRLLLVLWVVVGLPGFAVAWGFAGHAPWLDIPLLIRPENFDPGALIIWAFLISPFVLAPFAIDRKSAGDPDCQK